MTGTEQAIKAAEDRWRKISLNLQASDAPSNDLIKREQDAWDALTQLKDDADQCYFVGCRTRTTVHVRCPEHRT